MPERTATQQRLATAETMITEPQEWGRLVWMVSGRLGNSETMTMGRCYISPGQQNTPHHHPNCDEILHVINGRIEHMLNGELVEMGQGESISIPAGVRHNARNIGNDEVVLVICYSSPDRQTVGE